MSARIFNVSITVTTLVQADDSVHAERVAKQSFREIAKDTRHRDVLVGVMAEITSLQGLPDGWIGGCLPYGGNGTAELKDILPERAS
jgi:hypothetical protein